MSLKRSPGVLVRLVVHLLRQFSEKIKQGAKISKLRFFVRWFVCFGETVNWPNKY